jgi:hypothetical protein
VRWLPARTGPRSFTDPHERSTKCWAALRGRTRLSAPWNLAMIVAGAAAALTGRLLTDATTTTEAAATAALGALAALGVVTTARLRLIAVAAGAAVLVAVLVAQSVSVVAVLPWLAVLAAYVYFVSHSQQTMGLWGRRLRAHLCAMLAPAARLAIGHETWATLTAAQRADG